MNYSDIFIFAGPTISVDEARQHLKAIYLPPVKYGDVYRITELYQPKTIGIIDGHFNQVPAVWHKEILWAINQDISVFGASSMGALRAAELDEFGMIGCGKIYQAYQAGVLPPFLDESFEDDDEVAVIHGPAELGYQQASEAMVNIRFTLAKAHYLNFIDTQELKILTKIAKSFFYPDRVYSTIFELAQQQGLDRNKLADLSDWLKNNTINQKQLDAIDLLEKIRLQHEAGLQQSNSTRVKFQHTCQWQSAINEIDELHQTENPVLNEIRLAGELYFELADQVLGSNLIGQVPQALTDVDLSLLHQSPDELDQTLSNHWQIKQAQTTAYQLSTFQTEQLLVAYMDKKGESNAFSERAEDKKNKLNQMDMQPNINDLNELDLLQLSDWYFTQRLNTELPDHVEDYASRLDLKDIDDFYDMILREYYYLQIINQDGSGTPT